MERLGLEQKSGEAEPSKQELTRQLASKWNTLPPEDKKVRGQNKEILYWRYWAINSVLICHLFYAARNFFNNSLSVSHKNMS